MPSSYSYTVSLTTSQKINKQIVSNLYRKICCNKVQRRVFGLKREEVTGWWRKFRNRQLRNDRSYSLWV